MLSGSDSLQARQLLDEVLTELIKKGAVDFYCGGALGWDTVCANMVLYQKKRRAPQIRLHMVLPCPPEEQSARWSEEDRRLYYMILENSDDVEIISDTYTDGCMKKRNAKLIEYADCCVCYYDGRSIRSGTYQTVNMAKEKGISIINIYDMAQE